MKAAAKATGAEVKSTDLFTRAGAVEGIGSAAFFAEYSANQLARLWARRTANQTIVGKVIDRQDADMSKLPQQRDDIVLQLKSKKRPIVKASCRTAFLAISSSAAR